MSAALPDRDQRAADFLRLAADGKSLTEIARATNWSRRTVINDLAWVRLWLGADTTAHAVRLATLAGLI